MKANKWSGLLAAAGLILLIFDSKTVFEGASSGINICIKTVIPSLFPFFILSTVLSNIMQDSPLRQLHFLGRLCGIPQGSEYIFMLGIFGGYPVGAKTLSEAYARKLIGYEDANRMLCFCSNAGPSFIFGMAASLFSSNWVPWFLWGIQILSMILTAMVLPNKSPHSCQTSVMPRKNVMEQSIKAMATVCGWIIFMRVILSLIEQWNMLPTKGTYILTGILELSNGCIALSGCNNTVMRYILIGQFLSFGGICIILQTKSLIGNLNIKYYIIGKILQTIFSTALLFLSVPIVFPGNEFWIPATVYITISALFIALIRYIDKNNAGNNRIYAV